MERDENRPTTAAVYFPTTEYNQLGDGVPAFHLQLIVEAFMNQPGGIEAEFKVFF